MVNFDAVFIDVLAIFPRCFTGTKWTNEHLFDDIEENVMSAASVGFSAIHFSGIMPLRESLQCLGVKLDQP